MEEGQTPDSVEGDQHFDQKLFMLRFQRQSETINYTEGQRKGGGRKRHTLNMNTWKSFIVKQWKLEEDQWVTDKKYINGTFRCSRENKLILYSLSLDHWFVIKHIFFFM